MRKPTHLILLVCLPVTIFLADLHAQETHEPGPVENGEQPADSVVFTPWAASEYLINLIGMERLWRHDNDTLRISLSRLTDHFSEPYDSVRTRLTRLPFDTIESRPIRIAHHDTLPLLWLSKNVFIVDTVPLDKEPYITRETIRMKTLDSIPDFFTEEFPDLKKLVDSLLMVRDTITEIFIDYHYLASKNIQMHQVLDKEVTPPLLPSNSHLYLGFLEDSTGIVLSSYERVIMADEKSPFYIMPSPDMPDSLRLAVETLLAHAYQRDSVLLHIHDLAGRETPFWLSAKETDPYRFWVRNAENDSVTIWLGNPSSNTLALVLEEGINIERLEKQTADDIPLTSAVPKRVLATLTPIEEIPIYWNFGFNSSFALNQNYLSNWARGGESSLAGMIDISGRAVYDDKANKVQWTSSGRLRYGTIRTREHGFRTSTDIIEVNSQYNKELRKKLDFSAVLYGKTQLAEGFRYPNDSVVVSKFFNPGTFTVGVGMEYEPFKDTKLNFSVLSYRSTFVLDTANINQTTHGVDSDKRARREMGGQLVINNKMNLFDDLTIENAVRLFSNYLDKPQNIDVDWEINLQKRVSYYFTISINLHIIYDENILFPVLDGEGNPVTLPDGSPKERPRLQLKQFLGVTMSLSI